MIERLARTTLWSLAVLLGACSSFGGETDFDPAQVPVTRPGWVDRLQERVQPVPPEAQPEEARLATPTQWPADGQTRGMPRDLTSRISAPPGTAPAPGPGPGPKPAPAAKPKSDANTAAAPEDDKAETNVTVTVNNQLDQAAANATAQKVSQGEPSSSLESMYAGRLELRPGRSIRQFGYSFFERGVPHELVGSVRADYVLQPGDELHISLSGSLNGEYDRTVGLDGTVSIPEIGNVAVAGTTFGKVEQALLDYIGQVAHRTNIRVAVSIGRLQSFRVHVVGEVARPGIVEVPGRATVLTALAAAGGPRKTGSLRSIAIRRGGEIVATIDLYDFLISGETKGLDVLQPDDVIAVPPIGTTVGVSGYVQRPGIYEVKDGVTVRDVLKIAGGMTPFTFTPSAQLEKTVEGRGRARIDIALDTAGLATTMEDGELLLIGAVEGDRQPLVEIAGEVVRPDKYPFRAGMHLSDLLRMADGLTVDAYLPQALLSRQIGDVGSVTIVPQREAIGTTRRVMVLDLSKVASGDPQFDPELRPLDFVRVKSKRDSAPTPTVEVIGAVRVPGTYELTAGLTVSQLVAIAGNVRQDVYYDEAELIRRVYDEKTKQLGVERYRFDLGRALKDGGDADPVLANGDQLVIRALNSTGVHAFIEGSVRWPGEYVFPKGAKISDLIAAAGGLLDDADLRAAMFSRESVRRLQRERFEDLKERTRRLYEANLEHMVNVGQAAEGLAASVQLEQTKAMLERMDRAQATGRVVIPFTREDFLESPYDLTLEEGDSLRIPPRQETVAIMGHVFNPGAFVAEPGIDVADLIARSGGIEDDGDEERVYVIRADGTVQSLEQQHFRLGEQSHLLAGDVVLVPRRPLSRSLGRRIADLLYMGRSASEIAYILSQIGNESILNFTSVQQSADQTKGVEILGRDVIPK